jgi:hypothetical protein
MKKTTRASKPFFLAIVVLGLLSLLCQRGTGGVETTKEKFYVMKHFSELRKEFGKNNTAKPKIISGPITVKMRNDQSPGKEWQVALGNANFKVTIQDETKMNVEECLEKLEQIPPPYRKLFEIVSEGSKAGMAFYARLGGAAAHGGQSYLNMVPRANVFVIMHEAGHILEQRARASNPELLQEWNLAIDKDAISISPYGDSVAHEDLAEFALVYALCLDAGKKELAELKKLSPQRYALWEKILSSAEAHPSAPAPKEDVKACCPKSEVAGNTASTAQTKK